MWLAKAHEARNTCEVHLASMSMQDLAKLVPDQSDSLSELAGQNVGVISSRLGMEPLLLPCLVCLVRPVIDSRQVDSMDALREHKNSPRLEESIRTHKSKYGMPPTPWHLMYSFCNPQKRQLEAVTTNPHRLCRTHRARGLKSGANRIHVLVFGACPAQECKWRKSQRLERSCHARTRGIPNHCVKGAVGFRLMRKSVILSANAPGIVATIALAEAYARKMPQCRLGELARLYWNGQALPRAFLQSLYMQGRWLLQWGTPAIW